MNNILTLYKANKRLWQLGALFIIACILHNNPWLLDFLPQDAKQAVQTTAYYIINYAVGVIAFFVKQFNTSGNGTIDRPFEKPTTEGGSKTL